MFWSDYQPICAIKKKRNRPKKGGKPHKLSQVQEQELLDMLRIPTGIFDQLLAILSQNFQKKNLVLHLVDLSFVAL